MIEDVLEPTKVYDTESTPTQVGPEPTPPANVFVGQPFCGPCEGRHFRANSPKCWASLIQRAGSRYEGGIKSEIADPDGFLWYRTALASHAVQLAETIARGEEPKWAPPDAPADAEPGTPAWMRRQIFDTCGEIESVLQEKNRSYGNSALDPVHVFSSADAVTQLEVQLDHKLARLKRGKGNTEDTILDLIGYLVLLRIAKRTV